MSTQQSPQPFRWHYSQFDDTNFQIRGRTLFFVIVIFSVVLLLVLFFLYVRWACRFDHPPSSPSAAAPRGLDAASINSLPIVLHSNSESEEVECCICLGLFVEGDKVKVLPQCKHYFHSECVDMWLTTHSSCPLCRASLRVDSLV